jgi:gliding motility-associated-like protein
VKVQAYKADDYGSDTICEGESTLINFTPSKSYNSYLWVPGKYLSDSTILHPISTPAKSIDYTLVGDDGVCKDTMFYNIIVIPSLGFLNATVDNDSLVKGQSTTLHVTPSTWAVNWSPSSSLNDYTLVNPIATPPQSTMYTVTLAQSNLNCASSDSVFVFVYDVQCNEKDVYVPNIFTPNGDGKNDMLYVRGNNIKELYFTIYDRWGEKMFETTDQHVGWDGVYKGMTSDPAVFVYYLKVRCAGEKEFFIKGNITVMR